MLANHSRSKAAAAAFVLLALTLAGCAGQLTPTRETEGQAPDQPSEAPAIDLQEAESVTEMFTLMVPEGWSQEEVVPGAAFVMASSEAALDRYRATGGAEEGDLVVNVGFLPYRLLETNELRALDFQVDASPDVFLQSLMPMFLVDPGLTFSQADLVSLGNDREAGRMTVSAEGQEGIVLMFPAGDRVIAFVSAVTSPGGMAQFEDITYSIASGVTFGGDSDALFGALLGG
ncbi:MAG TPA: hypothetical protein VLL77_00685 [Anaerolineales bacterium]|nr:hypothetical protein [Anaerolineales bacterium]